MYLVQWSWGDSKVILQLMILKIVLEPTNLIVKTAKRETFFQVGTYLLFTRGPIKM